MALGKRLSNFVGGRNRVVVLRTVLAHLFRLVGSTEYSSVSRLLLPSPFLLKLRGLVKVLDGKVLGSRLVLI